MRWRCDKRAASNTRNSTATCRIIVHCLCEGQNVLDHCAGLLLNLTKINSLRALHQSSLSDLAARPPSPLTSRRSSTYKQPSNLANTIQRTCFITHTHKNTKLQCRDILKMCSFKIRPPYTGKDRISNSAYRATACCRIISSTNSQLARKYTLVLIYAGRNDI